MNQPSRERIDTLFSDALERAPESRRRFLVDACGADRELFGEVDSLLRAHEASGGFLERIVPESADPERRTTPTLANGRVLWERFEIVRFLGQGGMGEVYEAWDRDLGERVALKAIRPDVAAGAGALAAFQREIGMARTVASPYVGRIFDLYHHWELGDTETIHFVTMELLRGVNLRERLEEEGRLPWQAALPVLRHIARALEATAAVGIVHRDLKPDNVMRVGEGKESRAVVMDFGLAFFAQPKEEWVGHASPWTFGRRRLSSRAACGTPGYISPEQLRGETVDHRADFFSFGVLAYETLTGSVPFEAATGEARTSRFDRPPARLRTLAPSIPSELEHIVLRCLSIEPESRFQTAAELATALEVACRNTPTRRTVLLGGALAAAGALFTVEYGGTIATFVSGLVPRVLPLEKLTQSPEALSALREGFALIAAGENLASIAEFERALALEPELALAHVERIHALLNAGEDDRATDLLRRFDDGFAGVPLHPYVQKHLATMRSRAALKYHDAAEHERRLLAEFPDDLHVRLSHARRVEEAGLLREAVELYEPISAESVAALLGMGRALVFLGQPKRVGDVLEAPSVLGHLPNMAEARGMLHSILGRAHRDQGNLRISADHYEKSLDLRRRAGDRRGESGTLTNFAIVYKFLGRFEDANRLLERALELARASGDRTYQSFALLNLGRVLVSRGTPAEALPYLSESTAIEMERREESEMAERLLNLAEVYAALVRHEEALLFLEQSVPYAKRSGSYDLVAYGWWVRGLISLVRGEYDDAESYAVRCGSVYASKNMIPSLVDTRLRCCSRRPGPRPVCERPGKGLALARGSRGFGVRPWEDFHRGSPGRAHGEPGGLGGRRELPRRARREDLRRRGAPSLTRSRCNIQCSR